MSGCSASNKANITCLIIASRYSRTINQHNTTRFETCRVGFDSSRNAVFFFFDYVQALPTPKDIQSLRYLSIYSSIIRLVINPTQPNPACSLTYLCTTKKKTHARSLNSIQNTTSSVAYVEQGGPPFHPALVSNAMQPALHACPFSFFLKKKKKKKTVL